MTSRKKKPPPFRPAPYSSSGKTPPLPPKKAKKSVKLKEPGEGDIVCVCVPTCLSVFVFCLLAFVCLQAFFYFSVHLFLLTVSM